jgi:hypothetical protein
LPPHKKYGEVLYCEGIEVIRPEIHRIRTTIALKPELLRKIKKIASDSGLPEYDIYNIAIQVFLDKVENQDQLTVISMLKDWYHEGED